MSRSPKSSHPILKAVGLAGLGLALLIPGLDVLAAPALIAVLVGFTGGKK